MSKPDSGYFTGTSGQGKALIDEVIARGDKISPDKVLLITRDPQGRIIWLETGNSASGFQHIIEKHEHEFNGAGISNDDIPGYILVAVCQGNIVGTQGKRDLRTIYEFVYNGETRRVAVQVSSNGYIVSANPKSMEGK